MMKLDDESDGDEVIEVVETTWLCFQKNNFSV